jgi:hypothetical protein
MAGDPVTPFSVMQDITGIHWGPGEGPNTDLMSWLRDISAQYPEMNSYCKAASRLDYFEWCGLTVAYCMAKAGIKPIFGQGDTDRFLWADAWREWGVTAETPQQGDVVVFYWGGGHHHVTLFERDLGNGYWACRGGNQANEVKISNFPKSSATGIKRASELAPAIPLGGAKLDQAGAKIPAPAAAEFTGGGAPLTQAGLAQACQKLGVGVAEIWALTFTETDWPYGGCYADKRPQILFERHIFHRLTGGKFDQGYPDISQPTAGGYGAGGNHQYERLATAMSLDEGAALQSASWGIGQVLGENYKSAGFASPQALVTQLFASEDAQLLAVANEIIADNAAKALATHDWANFARIYNGPAYARNNYDTTLRTWYEKFRGGASPDLRVRSAQLYLMYLDYHPRDIDGSWGKFTQSAVNQFQAAKGMPITTELDDATFAAIEADGKAVAGGTLSVDAFA